MRALLMGGQACILYGGAQFSRDIDFAVAADPGNLERLRAALRDLRADAVYFPDLSAAVLRRGHACHFRCQAPGLNRLRVDVMTRMRGAAPFASLWRRRRELRLPAAGRVALVGLADLVRIKKTQRDKDWLMIRGLLEADVTRAGMRGSPSQVRFWLLETRTPALLAALAEAHPRAARACARKRPALRALLRGDPRKALRLLAEEERRERELDRRYWRPLRAELEAWRLGRPLDARGPAPA